MRKTSILYLAIFMLFSFIRCQQDFLETECDDDDFMKEAKVYFERNAPDIQNIKLGKQEKELSRSLNLSASIIIPRWQEQEYFKNGEISTLEVPLGGNVFERSIFSRKKSDGSISHAYSNITTKLVIQKHEKIKELRFFIATLIDQDYLYKTSLQLSKKIGYMNHPENGLMIISDVEGNYLDAFMYDTGKQKRVRLAKTSGEEENEIDTTNVVASFNLMKSGATTVFSRAGESGGGGTTVYCALCGKANCDGSCEVVVTYCRICHKPIDQCSGHTTPPDPDPTWYCPKCGSQYCSGNCQTGGGGTPGGTTTPSMSDKTAALFNKNGLGNDIKKFNNLMDELVKDSAYKAIFVYLKNKTPFEEVTYDPNMGEGTLYEGAEAAATHKRLKFKNEEAMNLENLRHEIYHMYQYRYFEVSDLTTHRHMVEFETAIYQDIAAFVRYGGNTEAILESGHTFFCIETAMTKYKNEYYTF